MLRVVMSREPAITLQVKWITYNQPLAQSGMFSSPGFGDGSGLNGPSKLTVRCGFSVVSIDRFGYPTNAAHGLVPGLVQSVPGAETFAFYFYLQHAIPDEDGMYIYYSDCQWVVDTWEGTKELSCSGWAPPQ